VRLRLMGTGTTRSQQSMVSFSSALHDSNTISCVLFFTQRALGASLYEQVAAVLAPSRFIRMFTSSVTHSEFMRSLPCRGARAIDRLYTIKCVIGRLENGFERQVGENSVSSSLCCRSAQAVRNAFSVRFAFRLAGRWHCITLLSSCIAAFHNS